jgi:hypothetical protein
MGSRRRIPRARRDVAAARGVQGGARGGEGVSHEDSPEAGGVRRVLTGGWRKGSERGVGARSGDDAVGGYACSLLCARTGHV